MTIRSGEIFLLTKQTLVIAFVDSNLSMSDCGDG